MIYLSMYGYGILCGIQGELWNSTQNILLTHLDVYSIQRRDLNKLGPRQNDHHFADDIFKCIKPFEF